MEQSEIFLIFTAPLESSAFQYMATGSVASMVYGTPRFTNDLDIVLVLPANRIIEFSLLFPLSQFYCPPDEVLIAEARRPQRGHFNIIHHETGYKADMYICSKDDLHRWALQNKRRVNWDKGKTIWIAPPEYVIIEKLLYYREGRAEKHIHDIQGMFAVSGDLIDYAILQKWVSKLGLADQWQTVNPNSPAKP